MSEEFDYQSIYNENTGYGVLLWFTPIYVGVVGLIVGFIINSFIDLNLTNGLAIGQFISIILFFCFFYFVNTKIKIKNYKKFIKNIELKLSSSD